MAAVKKKGARTLEGLLDETDEILQMAKTFQKEYMNRNGDVKSCLQPDFNACLRAIALKSELLGFRGKDSVLNDAQIERELSKLSLKLTKTN